jgi:hypothetical protein
VVAAELVFQRGTPPDALRLLKTPIIGRTLPPLILRAATY